MTFPNPPSDPRRGSQDPAPHDSELFGGHAPAGPPPAGPPAVAEIGNPTLAAGVGQPALLDDVNALSTTFEAKKAPSLFGRMGLVGAAVVLAGGAAFAVTQALEEPTGPATPDDAVAQWFEALDQEDFLGMTEVLLPSERESLVEPTLELLTELQRLEVLDSEMDLGQLSGVDFSVSGIQTVSSEIGQGVAEVRVVNGTLSSAVDLAELPIGDLVLDRFDDNGISWETVLGDEEVVDFSEDEFSLVVVEEDGSWYVSIWYGAAEMLREWADAPVPDFGNGVVPVGAASPEAVIEEILNDMLSLDPEGVIALLDPEEFRAIYDYAPLFLPDLKVGADELLEEQNQAGNSWSIDRLDLRTVESDGRTTVVIDGVAASATLYGDTVSVEVVGDCTSVTVNGDLEEWCGAEGAEALSEPDLLPLLAMQESLADLDLAMVVIERDGRWYLSFMPTVLNGYTEMLRQFERSDIDETIDGLTGLLTGDMFFGGSESSEFAPIGESIDGPVVEEEASSEVEVPSDEFTPDADDESITDDYGIGVLDERQAALVPSGLLAVTSDPTYLAIDGIGIPESFIQILDDEAVINLVEYSEGSGPAVLDSLASDPELEPFDLPGLPPGAAAYSFASFEYTVVYQDFLVIGYAFEGDGLDPETSALMLRQVEHLAGL